MAKQNIRKLTTKKPKKIKSSVDHGQWLSRFNAFLITHHYKVCGILFALSLLISIVYFSQGNNSPITSFYKWPNSDMSFFDYWAKKVAAGDWWGNEALHPYHDWHDDLADEYFNQFPEEKTKYIPPAADSTQTDNGKRAFINDLYNGKVYHQEPLYTYMLAVTYSIFGDDHKWVFFWQFLLGALTIVLIYLIGKNLFNPLSGLIAALMITFAGSVAFFTMVLLRTTLTNFFTVLLLYLLIRVAESPTSKRYVAFGVASGFAILSQSYIILFIVPALAWLAWKQHTQSKVLIRNIGVFAGSFLLILLPLFIRNIKVGAPVASVASHGTITFIPNNNATSQPMESFFINMASLAKISHDSKGHLIPAALASLGTFDSFGAFWKVY